jgi:prepilin-type N-terminal cleavage/methylation domain-containing protein
MKKGFTLIELLVVIAVFSALATVSSTILISFFRSENKIVATNNVRQRGDIIIDVFERDVRASKEATLSGVCSSGYCSITLTSAGGGPDVIWLCDATGLVPILSRSSVPETDTTADGTTIVSCNPGNPVFTVSPTMPKLVTFTIELTDGAGSSRVQEPFRTSVSIRNY